MIQPETLANRLGRIRRRVRRLVWIDGLSRVATFVIGTVFVVGLVDWLIHIDDPVIRLLLAVGIVAASAWTGWRYLIAPLSHPLSDSDVAFQIERRYPGFKDSLASTVQFLGEGTDARLGSPALQQLVIEQTLERLESVDLTQVLNSRAVNRVALMSAAVCGIVLTTAVANPSLAGIAVKRLANPFAANAWPLRTNLRLLNERLEPIERREGEPLRVVRNSELSIFVEDVKGRPPDEVRLEVQVGDGPLITQPLRRASLRDLQGESHEVFAARLPTEVGPVRFRAIGGDDSTMPYYDLEVVPPPAVEELQVTLTPPAYSQLPIEKLSPGIGHVQAIVGTRVAVRARLDQPVVDAALSIGEQPPVPVTLEKDSRTFAAEFTIEKEGIYGYGFELRDRFGFRFDEARYEIRARIDLAPQVSIEKPESDLTLTVDAQVPVKVTARDDLGLREMRLRYQIGESTDASAGITLPFEGDRVGPVSSELVWNMAELRPKEGTRIVYHAEAGDDFNLGPPHVGKSPQRAITIVSREEKANEVAAKQLALLEQLQTVRGAQDQAREQSGEIAAQWSKSTKLKSEDVDTLKRIDLDQRRIAARLRDDEQGVAAQAKELLDELAKNHVDNAEMNRRLARIVDEISQLSTGQFPQIEQKLTDALKEAENSNASKNEPKSEDAQKSAARGSASLDVVRQGQAAVVEGLDAVLRDLGKWRDQRELQSELEGMIARQKELNRDSSEVGKKTLTRALPELTPQEQADLARLAERQTQQAERLEKFTEGMREAAKKDANSTAGGDAGKAVQEKLSQQGNAGRMREAAERLRSNRVGDAASEQQSVLENLEEIEQLLKKPANRDLESQIADLRKAAEDVETLRKKQQEIAKETEELKQKQVPKDEAERLRKEQQAAREKAQEMEPKLRRLEANRAERSMSRAASRMQQAEQGLDQKHGDEAAENSSEAAEDLAQAERELAEKQREAEEQLARETLEKMADTLKGMVARQQSVVDETLRLDAERAKRGNWSRGQLKSLSELAGTQTRLKQETDDLVGKVKDAAVFAAALRSAASEMERAAARIEKRTTDATTVAAEKRAKQRFVDLVAALEKPKPGEKEEENQEQTEQNDQQQGSAPPGDVIALLAQLKLLKTLQVDLSERTAAIDQTTAETAQAKQDRDDEAARLAEEQRKLADLARDLANEIAKGAAGAAPEEHP